MMLWWFDDDIVEKEEEPRLKKKTICGQEKTSTFCSMCIGQDEGGEEVPGKH